MNKNHSYITFPKLLLFLCMALPGFNTPVVAQKKPARLPVRISVRILDHTDQKNLVLYQPGRNLEVHDFKGKPDISSRGVGATYSGILMEMQGLSKDGVMEIDVTLTVYFDKTRSWMKKEGRNPRVLAHEQNHFDLTAIKACTLAKAIQNGKFTSDNVQQAIRDLQAMHTSELNELQQSYDQQTQHGVIAERQAEWSARIAKGLAEGLCM